MFTNTYHQSLRLHHLYSECPKVWFHFPHRELTLGSLEQGAVCENNPLRIVTIQMSTCIIIIVVM